MKAQATDEQIVKIKSEAESLACQDMQSTWFYESTVALIARLDSEKARADELQSDLNAERAQAREVCLEMWQMRAELEREKARADAAEQDAARWQAVESADSELTLRLHNTRPDMRRAAIDAATGSKP